MTLLQTLQNQWEVVTRRFQATLVTAANRPEAEAVLQAVRGDELNRIVDGDPWASPAFGPTPPPWQALVVRDRRTREAVGVLQFTEAERLMDVPGTVDAYALDRLGPLVPKTMVVIFFALRPAYRKSAAGFVLLAELARIMVPRGFKAAAFIAEPVLLARYHQLGARPLAPTRASRYGGYRVPLYLLPGDKDRLEEVNSPLRFVLRAVERDEEALAWQHDFEARFGRIATGITRYDPAADDDTPTHAALTRGMQPVEIEAFLGGSLLIDAAVGDRLLAAGDGGRLLGIVHEGLVHVALGDRVLAALGPGELFGEMAFATGEPRTADVVAAAPGTQVLQISAGAVERLPPGAAARVWQNVAACLAARLAATTRRVSW